MLENDLDPATISVLANRFDAVVREMTNTLLHTGRSAVIATARDFSCSLVTAANELLAVADGLPVHAFSSHFQTAALSLAHPGLRDGDAFLHNDPYSGNTHSADLTVLVPVFVEGEHLFTTVAKAHQADIGNAVPSTYSPLARDVYEEGALVFPSVKVQSEGRDIEDIIRMCRARIRVPDQWHGDYLATVGAARIGERRLHGLAERYGRDTLRAFIRQWFDYSERRMERALAAFPAGRSSASTRHDPLPRVPDGIPINVSVEIDPEAGRVTLDLQDNIECVPAGVNLSTATATNAAITGLYNVLPADMPRNSGAFRRISVLLKDDCVVGNPRFPASCSMATTNVADRLVNATQSAFSRLVADGVAETGCALGPGVGVISGRDGEADFVNQIILTSNGGAANSRNDGWLTMGNPGCGGLIYRDSVEIDEQKYPMLIRSLEIVRDGGGAGEFRGAPPLSIEYGPTRGSMTIAVMSDCVERPAMGAAGGLPGATAAMSLGGEHAGTIESFGVYELLPGDTIIGHDAGGGGFGDPARRRPESVLEDVRERWISVEAAREVYRVALETSDPITRYRIDHETTAALRAAVN
ncbi:MAG: hydantoinase B/oxoprolinase family protein [Leucobacter sp.]